MSTARELGERIKNVMRNSRMAYKAQQIADELVDELVSLAQPGEGALTGWRSIETAPKDMTKYVVVRWIDREGVEHHDFDYTEDGCWMKWHDHAAHVEMIGGHGVSYTPPYLHFLQFPEPPDITSTHAQAERPLEGRCASDSDGDCQHSQCPQLRDNEPTKSGRSCPLYNWDRER